MADIADRLESVVEQLNERLRELERRVSALESQPQNSTPAAFVSAPIQRPRPPATWRGFPPAETPAGAVPVMGKAVLGIAGAYLLRALAESGAIPKLPVLIVAIAYAGLWMVLAFRQQASHRVAGVTYAVTSALILSPLLWESTVRFRTLSPAFTGFVLVAYVVLALVLGWRRELVVIPWVATLAATLTALALILATHDLMPLTAALLVVALAVETAACLGHQFGLRAVPAIAADLAVFLLVFVMTSSEGIPEGYRPISPAMIATLCLALLAIYGGSIGVRSFVELRRMTIFEIGQAAFAFILAAIGVMRATQDGAAPALGILFLLLAAVCYWGTLSRFAGESYTRNRRVSANWAAALLLAGSFLLFPGNLQVPFLCLAALIAAFLYPRTGKMTLGLHASLFLAASAVVSPTVNYIVDALSGTVPGAPGWEVWVTAVAAAACYAIGSRKPEDQVKRRLLWVVPAVLVSFAAAALAVAAIAALAAGRMELSASRLSVVRTIVNCVLALTLAFLGSRFQRVELGWVAYAAVAFGTLKLLFEDLRFGNAASLVVSLLFYGLILILLPRVTQRRNESNA